MIRAPGTAMTSRELDLLSASAFAEEKLRLILEAAHLGTWEWDLTRDRIGWSDTFEELHGFARGAFGNSFQSYQRNIHPDDRERVQNALQACAAGGSDYSIEYRLIAPSGEVHYVEAQGRLVHDATGAARLMGMCRDVSERMR